MEKRGYLILTIIISILLIGIYLVSYSTHNLIKESGAGLVMTTGTIFIQSPFTWILTILLILSIVGLIRKKRK